MHILELGWPSANKANKSRLADASRRSLKRYDLADLLALESRLKAQVARENKAQIIDSGLGDPNNLFIRFGNG